MHVDVNLHRYTNLCQDDPASAALYLMCGVVNPPTTKLHRYTNLYHDDPASAAFIVATAAAMDGRVTPFSLNFHTVFPFLALLANSAQSRYCPLARGVATI